MNAICLQEKLSNTARQTMSTGDCKSGTKSGAGSERSLSFASSSSSVPKASAKPKVNPSIKATPTQAIKHAAGKHLNHLVRPSSDTTQMMKLHLKTGAEAKTQSDTHVREKR